MKRTILFILLILCALIGNSQQNCPYVVDTTFQVNMNGNLSWYAESIKDFFIEDDGKIVVSGNFENISNSTLPSKLVRLNSDGSLDYSFHYTRAPALTFDLGIPFIKKHNGQYYIGIDISPGISRLNLDGEIDTTYKCKMMVLPLEWSNWSIIDMYIYPDGKVLLAGKFKKWGKQSEALIRLTADGNYDSSFYSTKADYVLTSIKPLNNGKFLIGGWDSDTLASRSGLWRINSDGTLDTTFNSGCTWGVTNLMEVLDDGKILTTGTYDVPPYNSYITLARWCQNGELDTTFNYYYGNWGSFGGFVIQDGKIVTAGHIDTTVSVRFLMAVFDTLGHPDPNLFGQWGPDSTYRYKYPYTGLFKETSDKKILIGGHFNSFGGHPTFCMARLCKNTVGIEESQSKNTNRMKIFPNPAKVTTSVLIPGNYLTDNEKRIEISDISGNKISDQICPKGLQIFPINISDLKSGIYLIQIISNSTIIGSEKLIIP